MERGENERQHRLGDPRARRERARERLEALVPAQLVDERSERASTWVPAWSMETAGIAPRGAIVLGDRTAARGRARQTIVNHPQGHPRCPDATLSAKV